MRLILSIFVFVIGLFCTAPSYSQDKDAATKEAVSIAGKQQSFYIEKLNLNEKQSQEFVAINNDYKKSVSDLKVKSKSKKSVKKIKSLEEKRDKELKDLLSKEQFEKYLELRREKRNSLKTLIRKSNGQ